MKKVVKTLAVLMVLALVIALAAACRDNEPEPTPDPIVEQPPVEQPPVEQPPVEEPPTEEPGREYRELVLTGWFMPTRLTADDNGVLEEPDPAVTENYHIERMMWDNLQRVMEEYNVSIRFEERSPVDILTELGPSVMAGSPIADIVMMQGIGAVASAMNGILHNVRDISPANSPVWSNPIGLRPAVTLTDGTFSVWHNGVWQTGWALVVNLDMVDRLGLDNPVELFESGNWNWDTFRQVLQDATQASAGGEIDHVGFAADHWALFTQLIGVNDGFMVDPVTYQVALGQPNAMAALELAYNILIEDNTWAAGHEGIPAENILLTPMHANGWGNVPFRFSIVPFPAGPNNQSGVTTAQSFHQGFAFPIGIEDPEFVFHILEEIYRWTGDTADALREQGLEAVRGRLHYEADMTRFLNYIEPLSRQRHEIGWIATPDFVPFFVENFWENFADRTMTPATAVTTFEQPLQDIVDRWLAGE